MCVPLYTMYRADKSFKIRDETGFSGHLFVHNQVMYALRYECTMQPNGRRSLWNGIPEKGPLDVLNKNDVVVAMYGVWIMALDLHEWEEMYIISRMEIVDISSALNMQAKHDKNESKTMTKKWGAEREREGGRKKEW